MERKTNKCESFQTIRKKMLYQKRRWLDWKFDSQVDKGILVLYSSKTKAYKFLNIRLNIIVERINVMIDEAYGRKKK
jgi:hypothetical protein